MNAFEDITRKRSMLLTARMRFSPQIQPVKETAIDKIIEQILFFVTPTEKGLSVEEIQYIFSSGSVGYAISSSDVENSCKRLGRKQRIVPQQKGDLELYRLSEKASRELGGTHHRTEVRFNSVVNRLFKNAKEGASAFRAPFLKLLCIIFSQLAEEYVRVIKGDIKADEFLSFPFVSSALKEVKKEFVSIDGSLFESATLSFFRDSDPEYDAIKWNMVQNYYIAKALGLDPGGVLLSKEAFGHAIFYLDTNIIIEALEPKDRYHKSFLAFNKACKQLGITLKVCQISLDELRNWLAYQRELMEKVIDQIPDEAASEVSSIFYEIYCEKKRAGEAISVGEFFTSFDSPMDQLKGLFEVELEDDIWFDEAKNKAEAITFAETLRSKFFAMRRRYKSRGAAIRDALLLLWLQKLREENGDNIWLITTDTSLPTCPPPNASSGSLAITLDAILQWISTMVVPEDAVADFTSIFAEMLKYRLLPQDRIFDLEDFLIFHEMHLSCKELPAEDVENCIRYIRVNAPMLDPSDPADREKLAYEVSKFFADPGRKYKQEIARLEAKKDEVEQEYKKDLEERDGKIEELERKFSEYSEKTGKESLRRSAQLRLGITTIVFLVLEGLVVILASQYGEGSNLFQKVLNSWYFLVGGFAITIALGWFFLGKKRLEALGWSFTKIFRSGMS
ncbi:MAG TPA: hypothetical protein G4N93_05220 [Dehalococcoidia bacterium]|nr:hypothetical protein [Dehalococcoidia bacterium]